MLHGYGQEQLNKERAQHIFKEIHLKSRQLIGHKYYIYTMIYSIYKIYSEHQVTNMSVLFTYIDLTMYVYILVHIKHATENTYSNNSSVMPKKFSIYRSCIKSDIEVLKYPLHLNTYTCKYQIATYHMGFSWVDIV
jgi:hypothetical protein